MIVWILPEERNYYDWDDYIEAPLPENEGEPLSVEGDFVDLYKLHPKGYLEGSFILENIPGFNDGKNHQTCILLFGVNAWRFREEAMSYHYRTLLEELKVLQDRADRYGKRVTEAWKKP